MNIFYKIQLLHKYHSYDVLQKYILLILIFYNFFSLFSPKKMSLHLVQAHFGRFILVSATRLALMSNICIKIALVLATR